MAATDFHDLILSAEQLTAEFDGVASPSAAGVGAAAASAAAAAADLPRVERNLGQLVEAGQQLLSKTAGGARGAAASGAPGGGAETTAVLLMGSRGVDLTAMNSK